MDYFTNGKAKNGWMFKGKHESKQKPARKISILLSLQNVYWHIVPKLCMNFKVFCGKIKIFCLYELFQFAFCMVIWNTLRMYVMHNEKMVKEVSYKW